MTVNISEKNIINNLFNLIDNGLDSNFENFSFEVKTLNDKLISKAKETHETTTSKPRDNINLRKFLQPKIHYIELKEEIPKKYNENEKRNYFMNFFEKNKNNEEYIDENGEYILENKEDKKEEEEQKESSEEDDDIEDKETKIQNENLKKIEQYKSQLYKEQRAESDEILLDYISNFVNIKVKYFSHLKPFQIEKYFKRRSFFVYKIKKNKINNNNIIIIKSKR